MEFQITAGNFTVPEELRELVRLRLSYALGRFQREVSTVRVHLTDLNGPRGGLDKQCKMHAVLKGASAVMSEVTDSEFESAVTRAAKRLSRGLLRQIERRRNHNT